ncbi:uncharacterized protein LOC127439057 [Myxocyprinus asiaticus]|uniref:uncharacterized protein LOC127439057 n=1 Tax=Myxocyprinus asiaticus TaxID=70543 RepID=UPI0022220138|nr:uncharacterized protein LOC127439057 [Myxocyprinus asiaticus]
MRMMQLQLFLLIWCQAAETFTDQLTDLGQNVTINCDLNENDIYWFVLKLYSPVLVLRSFSISTTPFHYNERFRHKYSVQTKHRLFINDVTIDELGVYYCMNTDAPPKFGKSTRLHIIEPTQLTEFDEFQNHTVLMYIQKNQTEVRCIQQNQSPWQTLTLISALMNGVLLIVVIGLLKAFVVGNRRSAEHSQQLHNTDLQQTQVMSQNINQLQYAEVDFSKLRKNIPPCQANCTYGALKLPTSQTEVYCTTDQVKLTS